VTRSNGTDHFWMGQQSETGFKETPRRPSRIDIKPCDTLTHTHSSVELLAGRLDFPSVRICMAGAHQFCDASPPEDSVES